jgi:hypothetical protein
MNSSSSHPTKLTNLQRYVPTMDQIIEIYTTGQNPDPERIPQLTVNKIVHSMTYKHVTGDSKSAQYRRKKYKFPLTLEPAPPPHPNCTFCDPDKLRDYAKTLQTQLFPNIPTITKQ